MISRTSRSFTVQAQIRVTRQRHLGIHGRITTRIFGRRLTSTHSFRDAMTRARFMGSSRRHRRYRRLTGRYGIFHQGSAISRSFHRVQFRSISTTRYHRSSRSPSRTNRMQFRMSTSTHRITRVSLLFGIFVIARNITLYRSIVLPHILHFRSLQTTNVRTRLLTMGLPVSTIQNRRFIIHTAFRGTPVLRRRGRIKVLSQQGTIDSYSGHLLLIRVTRIPLGLYFHFRVSNTNHVIRGRGQQVINRDAHRTRSLLLSTKRTSTTFTSSNVMTIQRTTSRTVHTNGNNRTTRMLFIMAASSTLTIMLAIMLGSITSITHTGTSITTSHVKGRRHVLHSSTSLQSRHNRQPITHISTISRRAANN